MYDLLDMPFDPRTFGALTDFTVRQTFETVTMALQDSILEVLHP